MKAMMLRSFLGISCALALCSAMSGAAQAGQVVGWWGGSWACNIDGRPARMKWAVVDDSRTTCNGNVCSTSSGVRWQGSFSDNGSRWVPLTGPRQGSQGGLFFRHADGNQWYLARPVNRKSVGWTTWNAQRYTLACWK